MPQMMPINWLMSLLIFILIFIMFNIMNYYIFNYNSNIINKKIKMSKKLILWKW
uniref:ATP synthase complex subunit 8 n=1 Tax=Polyura nepenthes TaxID=213157 RepID=A0A0A7AUT0_9NEOP|nr:ATP synthase F0 subunit 8 [Polyura nepenthes]AHL17307.1 ATP synthase F0 subunit 8 [Polyura nepenthes]